jgi:hypothetical protein
MAEGDNGQAAPEFVELGASGLDHSGGYVNEEQLRQLKGTKAAKAFDEMAENDAIIGAFLYALETLVLSVKWRDEPFSQDPDDVAVAEFVKSCREDMATTWHDVVCEALSFVVHGWSCLETIYKLREGPKNAEKSKRSRYSDGLVGWAKLAARAQSSLQRWNLTDLGEVLGWYQWPPNMGREIYLPAEKILLFRTTSRKNNPEGRSLLRRAFVSYQYKKRIEGYEAIGIERDLAGLPVFEVPSKIMSPDATAAEKAVFEACKKIVRNIRVDDQGGIVACSDVGPTGEKLYALKLLSTGSTRAFDTDKVVQRHDRRMAMSVLADFILLGHEQVGSYSLSSDKTSIFAMSVGSILNRITSVFNLDAIPRLIELNGWDPARSPKLKHGDLEKPDIDRFAAAVAQLTGSGNLTPGSEEDEKFFRSMLNMPMGED